MRRTVAANISSTTWATVGLKKSARRLGIESRRWALACAAADLRGPATPTSLSLTIMAFRSFISTITAISTRRASRDRRWLRAQKRHERAFGDIFNQGKYSIYVSNISEEGILIQGNNLWVPQEGNGLHYANLARDLGVELGGWSFGAQFGDLNNDGNLDLFLENGYISLSRSRSYWYDFSKVAGGNSSIISDASHWPAFDGRSLSGYQQKKVWMNDGAGKFEDVAQAVGVTDTWDGRAIALADLWNTGVLDAVVANQGGPLLIYKDTVAPGNDWIEFDLEGTKSNRSAIGAQVTLFWNGQKQIQYVSGGNGFASENDRRLALRSGKESADREGRDPLAFRNRPDAGSPDAQPTPSREGARMSWTIFAPSTQPEPALWKRILDSRFMPPIFITLILLVGNFSFGILESYTRTLLAILTSITGELILGRIFLKKWPHPASAYITGISVGILLRSPAYWTYALCAALSITSKYTLRFRNRHIFNPSNFGICAMLFLASDSVAGLSIQWGNNFASLVAHLDSWLGDRVARAPLQYHSDVRCLFHRTLVPALLDHWRSLAIGNFPHHGSHVSALHFLHDHRPEDNRPLADRSVPRCLRHCPGGVLHAPGQQHLRAVIRSVLGGTRGVVDRDVA
jgi:hypothetical protein